jgi:hypothetical protein
METAPDTHWIGGRVGSRAALDAVVRRKIPSLRRESNPRTPIKITIKVLEIYVDFHIPKVTNFDISIFLYTVVVLWAVSEKNENIYF